MYKEIPNGGRRGRPNSDKESVPIDVYVVLSTCLLLPRQVLRLSYVTNRRPFLSLTQYSDKPDEILGCSKDFKNGPIRVTLTFLPPVRVR